MKLTKGKLKELNERWVEHNQQAKKSGVPKYSFDEFLNYIYGKRGSKSNTAPLKVKTLDYRKQSNVNVSSTQKEIIPTSCSISRSVLDPRVLAIEKPETRNAIIAKSYRIMPLYNKGAHQYITDGEDVTTLGSRSRR